MTKEAMVVVEKYRERRRKNLHIQLSRYCKRHGKRGSNTMQTKIEEGASFD